MVINISSLTASEMIEQIARRTGESREEVVRSAVESRLRALLVEGSVNRILERGAEVGALLGLTPGEESTVDFYDDDGLPR